MISVMFGVSFTMTGIRAALVWTEMPDLMEISAAMLDEAAARITSR